MKANILKIMILSSFIGGFITSCSDSVELPRLDEKRYVSSERPLSFITDKYGASEVDSIIFNNKGKTDMYVNLNSSATDVAKFSIVYNASVLEQYNKKHGTKYEIMPKELVAITTTAKILKGEDKSTAISVAYKTSEHLKENSTYAIPLSINSDNGIGVSERGNFILLVRDISKMPNCHKAQPFINISMPEVNDSNPLNALCFTLKNSKKYFFDQVVLFSGNINYNEETGEVYNKNNENVQHLLDYKEKYIDPLREKGIKVIMGILPNHDRAGITNLSEEGAKAFARNMKAMCDAYDLDGVFLDDEYGNEGDYPGFERSNVYATSRLCYYLKEYLGPNRLVEVYVYSRTGSLVPVNGKKPGEFIDFAIQDYGRCSDLSYNYPGLSRRGMIQASNECSRNYYSSNYYAQDIVSKGYGGTMWFGFDPSLYRMNINAMQTIARSFYNDDIVYDNKPFRKDW